MQNNNRKLYLDICDYNRKKLCPIYDNYTQLSGQAHDVIVTTERNGWKELSFSLPSVCSTGLGFEENYRTNFLQADYLIRLIDDVETDWYIISEPKITHNAFTKTIQVTAGHISQLLKNKNLGLEFSDDEGNNIGTAQELATTILAGTGWSLGYVYPFAERDGKTKYRSMKASAKTGAFKLMSMMCELFDAKPVYHGDSRTVDILPINPFSEPDEGMLPDLSLAREVTELHYGKNIKNVSRTLNTENMVTKLYAYGAYGDKTSGYCGLDECIHTEYTYVLTSDCTENTVYNFTFKDSAGVSLTYHFTAKNSIKLGSKLIYSLIDQSSMLYIWDDENKKAYPVYKGTVGEALPAEVSVDEDVQNWFQFVMNFDYYRDVGLFTDDMIQILGDYQRTAPIKYEEVSIASAKMSEAQTELSKTIGVIDFCKLDISREEPLLGDGYTVLVLNKDTYKDGVIYRTDYDKNKDNYFKWRITESINTDGDPINSAAGVVYVIHDTNPVSWDKAYLKYIYDEDAPTAIALWAPSGTMNINADSDQFFLFSYNGINGHLGVLESNDESAIMSLEESLRVVTVDHPVYFTTDDPYVMSVNDVNGYGWAWRYKTNKDPSEMFFTFKDDGDTSWNLVYFQEDNPGSAPERSYWYDWRNSVLYRKHVANWEKLETAAQLKVAELFATVYMFGKARDRYHQGVYENYIYTVPEGETLNPGNYFFENEYNSYWTFTTTEKLNGGDTLTYNFDDAWVTQIRGGIESTLKPKGYRFDNVNYHPSNVLAGRALEPGSIETDDGALVDSQNYCRMQSCVSVVPNTRYNVSGIADGSYIHFYDDKKNWMDCISLSEFFVTPGACSFIRVSAPCSVESHPDFSAATITAVGSENIIVIEDLNYNRLFCETSGDIIGLSSCFERFANLANLTYDQYYKELKAAQDVIAKLEMGVTELIGDLYREGWWQDASYVDGDEDKLYYDALDNLKEISKPEATYNIGYLDLYGANDKDAYYGASDLGIDVVWPDLSIMDAVHLIDPEISVNTWAFIDKIQKCYDNPKKTKITINTKLSNVGQHSFADVMTNIANVASEMKGKASYYDKTISTSASNADVDEIVANLSKAERELLSTYSRVERIGDELITHSSRLKQTEDGIEAEVRRSTEQDTYLSSQVKIAADKITSVVTQDTTSSENNIYVGSKLQTSIEQTAKDITSIVNVSDAEGSIYKGSMLQQTLDGFNLRVEDLENSSSLQITPEVIRAVVRGDAEYGGEGENEFNTSSVSVSKNGVTIDTTGTFSVSAGDNEEASAVVIDKNGVAIGSTGAFTVDTDNFGVNSDGHLSANGAVINGQISNNGYPVLTKNYDLYVGSTEPSNKHIGMLWIKPGATSSGGGSGDSGGGDSGGGDSGGSGDSGSTVVPTNQPVTFTGTTGPNRHWFYESGSANVTVRTSSYSAGVQTSYHYTVTVPLYLAKRSDDGKHGAIFKASLNGSFSISKEVDWSKSESATNMYDTITIEGTSSVWLGNLSSMTVTISVKRLSSDTYTGNIYLDREKEVKVICS